MRAMGRGEELPVTPTAWGLWGGATGASGLPGWLDGPPGVRHLQGVARMGVAAPLGLRGDSSKTQVPAIGTAAACRAPKTNKKVPTVNYQRSSGQEFSGI